MATLEAPTRMRRRDDAAEFVAELPVDLAGQVITVKFPCGALGTTSFVDELVRTVLVERHAKGLVLVAPPPRVAELAEDAAADFGVLGRLSCT